MPDSTAFPDSPVIVVAPPDTLQMADTALTLPQCLFCKYATSLRKNQWNFRVDTLFFCGAVTNGVLSPEKNALTFFGPSSCNAQTGLIITAYFDQVTFDADRAGITSTRVTMQYYDNAGGKDIFLSGSGTLFNITINQFEARSATAIGRFNGTVLARNGQVVPITEGNFKIELH